MPVIDSQSNRNFRKNIEILTEEEREFFEAFCIDLNKINIDCGILYVSPFLREKKYWECDADLFFYGNIISAPEKSEIKIGRFVFDIIDPDDMILEDSPEGSLNIAMTETKLEWLLDEKCEDIESDESIISRTGERIENCYYKFRNWIYNKMYRKKIVKSLYKCLKELGIDIKRQCSKNEIEDYKKNWVNQYTSNPDIAQYALPSPNWHNYLWHVFSYEKDKAIEGDKAKVCYDNTEKTKVVIYIDDAEMLLFADNIQGLTAQEIERMCDDEELDLGNLDIVVTAEDFSWTYCRTHETGWIGPYFFNKKEKSSK